MLSKGEFINSNQDNYKYIDENFNSLYNYFEKYNFILEHTDDFFYLSR